MDLKTLYQEVLTNFQKNGMELHTRLDDVGNFVFANMSGKYNYSNSVLDQNLKLLMLLECVLWEKVYLEGEFPEKTYDFITLVKNYYAYDIELVSIVKFLVATKNFTHFKAVDNSVIRNVNEELLYTCTRLLLELRTQVNNVSAKKKMKDGIDMPLGFLD